ncbi:WhiB family transcriptional regulator [Nocardiopsis gilva YIM 90087]|uniref:Transcriptional regulator WhiB n=1 Tax=Nocardiopsis gilva YIM 90087 TaxID=1235441 RepID=A0A223SDK3_9ACTN|nr:WhiB family transcriptional regulator [Nocardiopsis gilva YIM 90087]
MEVGPVDTSWHPRAACRGADPELFYPRGRGSAGVARARRICKACPTRQLCLDAALAVPHALDYGIWAGTTREQRRRMRQDRAA